MSRVILIADSGATKADWALLEGGAATRRIATQGLHPLHLSPADMEGILATELLPRLGSDAGRIDVVYFYGAGVLPHTAEAIHQMLFRLLAADRIMAVQAFSDLTGAARALCGRQPGIACILGTGSNSCQYDGRNILVHVPPLGFILGDEGSGASLGKRLVADALKGRLPAGLKDELLDGLGMTEADVIDRVYRRPQPARFLASLAPFLRERLEVPAVHALVKQEFTAFLSRNVMAYDYRRLAMHCTGSVAYHFAPVLREAAGEAGIAIGAIAASPMEGLIGFHRPESQ